MKEKGSLFGQCARNNMEADMMSIGVYEIALPWEI